MSKKKAIVYTSLFIIAILVAVAILIHKDAAAAILFGFMLLPPFPVGLWLADLIGRFYQGLCKKIK